jgi:hypothetical protein
MAAGKSEARLDSKVNDPEPFHFSAECARLKRELVDREAMDPLVFKYRLGIQEF